MRGGDNRLYHCTQNRTDAAPDDWGPWQSLLGSVYEVDVVADSARRLVVLARDTDNSLWRISQTTNRSGQVDGWGD